MRKISSEQATSLNEQLHSLDVIPSFDVGRRLPLFTPMQMTHFLLVELF